MKKSNLQFYCAASVLLLIIGASILAPLLVTHNPFEPDMANRLPPPSWQHFFGTDALGRDMFSRILYGGRATILLSLASAILSLGVGRRNRSLLRLFTAANWICCALSPATFSKAFRAAAL